MNERQDWTPDTLGTDRKEQLLSAREAAAALGIHERTIRRAIARGWLSATKRSGIWSIDPDDLAVFAPGQRRHTSRTVPVRPAISLVPSSPTFLVPLPRTPLIGREREIDAVRALVMDDGAPLVTLTGPGGSGKTRLALAIADNLRDCFVDGIWFVDLSALQHADLVPGAIVQTLGLREMAGQTPFDRLQAYFQSRSTLVVLDNVEQVIAAASAIGQLLTASPGLQLLATSRVPLRVSMEHQFQVVPLDLPRSDHQPDRVAVEAASATRLFQQTAQRVRRGFQMTDANAPAVAALCARLDGLPLAIELAAAQSAMHSPETLLARLGNRLDVLDNGPLDAPSRLRSMRDAIGWSYDLLDERLQQRFRRLCVFEGGFTTDAAAVVTSHPPLDGDSVDEDIRALVEANLVVANPQTSRFTMLETIRAFGQDQLENENERESLRETHTQWCLDLLTRARGHWFTPTQTEWGDLIEQEYANLRAALAWLSAANRQTDLVTLTGLMWPFWFVRHHWLEGVGWLERALDATVGQHTRARIRILTGAACLWIQRDDEPMARAFGEEALVLCQEFEVVSPPDSPLIGLAICANMRGDYEEGQRINLQSLAMLRDHAPSVSVILCNMAWTQFELGEMDEAESLALESLVISRDLDFDWSTCDTLHLIARIAEARGEHQRATACYRESLRLAVETRDLRITASNLERSAHFLAGMGEEAKVALLFGASARLHEIIADVQREAWKSGFVQLASWARARLGDESFDRLYRHGQAMPLEEIMAVGLEATVPPVRRDVPQEAARWGITRREFDVLMLVAQGLTDQEIADALFIGRRTVNSHVSHLLARLGTLSRQEAVRIARAEGLLASPNP